MLLGGLLTASALNMLVVAALLLRYGVERSGTGGAVRWWREPGRQSAAAVSRPSAVAESAVGELDAMNTLTPAHQQ